MSQDMYQGAVDEKGELVPYPPRRDPNSAPLTPARWFLVITLTQGENDFAFILF